MIDEEVKLALTTIVMQLTAQSEWLQELLKTLMTLEALTRLTQQPRFEFVALDSGMMLNAMAIKYIQPWEHGANGELIPTEGAYISVGDSYLVKVTAADLAKIEQAIGLRNGGIERAV